MEQVNSLDDFGGNQKLPNATATLVLGIVSIATCIFYGIPGIICGIIAIVSYKKIRNFIAHTPTNISNHHLIMLKQVLSVESLD